VVALVALQLVGLRPQQVADFSRIRTRRPWSCLQARTPRVTKTGAAKSPSQAVSNGGRFTMRNE
jgi:hypothetical protein